MDGILLSVLMKKIISIPLLLLILFSGIKINIASHYCGGNYAATKVSLNGELASCGMVHKPALKTRQAVLTSQCCEDVMMTYSISTNYVPSTICCFQAALEQVIHSFIVPGEILTQSEHSILTTTSEGRPPGLFCPESVEQQVICIFRI